MSLFDYFMLHGERTKLRMIRPAIWENFTTWVFYRYSCVVYTNPIDFKGISHRYTWLNDNIGEMHKEWRWKIDQDASKLHMKRYDRLYFKNGKDRTAFLLRWA